MNKPEVLITGAGGEVGHGLINFLSQEGHYAITAMDLRPLHPDLQNKCAHFYQGDVRNRDLIETLVEKHQFDTIFHLAGVLSTSAEKNPVMAHEVNVDGSFNIVRAAQRMSETMGKPVKLLFTSTIAVYGLDPGDAFEKELTEWEYLKPHTMYGVNKLYVEFLGRYLAGWRHPEDPDKHIPIDFRALRFPGLISSETMPTGGTSDYGPEMLHAAAQGKDYECFVRPDTTLPFMVMEDGIRSLIGLSRAEPDQLQQRVYNVSSFSVSAEEMAALIGEHFEGIKITYKPNARRQAIVDSWPRFVDDGPARRDWNWQPKYDFKSAFEEVLIPSISARYR